MKNIKTINGIDSLYYFCESNLDYDDLFFDILDQIEDNKGVFEKKDIEYEYRDILININGTTLNYRGKKEGFHWFRDMNEFFKIGFKDKKTNRGLNDIRVQLQAVGIYTIGITSLIKFINEELLKGYVTGYNPITRADLNCFVQYDFSFLTKEMFSTRKRKYAMISEIGSSKETQTIYIGKAPFLLRIYNKREQLKKDKKKDLMYEFYMSHGFNNEDHIFNVEFELHRTHLKQYNIKTVDDLLSNAVMLFKQSMDDIRLIDINSITQKELEHNKYNASTLSIWKYIKDQYDIKEFLQTTLPLEKIKRAVSVYDDRKFEIELIAVLRRAFINNLNIEPHHMDGYYYKAKNSLKKTTTNKEIKQNYKEYYKIDDNGKRKKVRELDDGAIIEPNKNISVKELLDYDLIIYLDKLTSHKDLSDHDYNLWSVAYKEAVNRGLIPTVGNNEALESVDESW